MSETYKIDTTFGMQVHLPNQYIISTYQPYIQGRSKWEKRRDKIIDKMRFSKAIFNWFLKHLLFVVSLPVTFCIWLWLLHFAPYIPLAILCGCNIFFTWVVTYILLSDIIETNRWRVNVKHRGKIY